jgi:hypothetical protein
MFILIPYIKKLLIVGKGQYVDRLKPALYPERWRVFTAVGGAR